MENEKDKPGLSVAKMSWALLREADLAEAIRFLWISQPEVEALRWKKRDVKRPHICQTKNKL